MMGLWTAIKGSKAFAYLAFAAAVVWGLVLVIGRLMSAGAAKEQAAQAARANEERNKADEVRTRVDAASDAELDDGVRKWTRE